MNNFINTLKKVTRCISLGDNNSITKEIKYQYGDTVTWHMEDELIEIQEYLNDNRNTNLERKNFTKAVLKEIINEKQKVDQYLVELQEKDNRTIAPFVKGSGINRQSGNIVSRISDGMQEVDVKALIKLSKKKKTNNDFLTLTKLEEEIQLIIEIERLIEDAQRECLRYLITFYPEEFKDPELIAKVKELAPKDSEILIDFSKKKNSTFESMFKEPLDENAKKAELVLKKMKLPAISEDGSYLKTYGQGIFRVWYSLLRDRSIINNITHTNLAKNLNSKFSNLRLDQSVFSGCEKIDYYRITQTDYERTKKYNQLPAISIYSEMESILDQYEKAKAERKKI